MSLPNFGTASRSLTQKSEKNLADIKIDFSIFLGSASSVTLFSFFHIYNCTLFFSENIFIGYNSGLFDDLVGSTLLAGGKSKKKKMKI
jgi:hypothetical protein